LDAIDVFDQFVENDVIRRFSGNFFTPLNPADPDAPEEAVPDIVAQIEADNSSISVQNSKFTQRIPRQTYLQLGYNPGAWWVARFGLADYQTATFYHVRGEFWQRLALEWHPSVSAIGIEFYHPIARLRLATDDFDLSDAKYLSLTAALQLVF
jgi:hypothetical protein